MKWVPVSERQPEHGGIYAVIRRGRSNTHYPDVCRFKPAINGREAYWSAGRGPITSVEQWLEDNRFWERVEELEKRHLHLLVVTDDGMQAIIQNDIRAIFIVGEEEETDDGGADA